MKILVINNFGNGQIVTTDFVPRIGDKVDMFHEPLPTVNNVVAWPSSHRLESLSCAGLNICAIVTVS